MARVPEPVPVQARGAQQLACRGAGSGRRPFACLRSGAEREGGGRVFVQESKRFVSRWQFIGFRGCLLEIELPYFLTSQARGGLTQLSGLLP